MSDVKPTDILDAALAYFEIFDECDAGCSQEEGVRHDYRTSQALAKLHKLCREYREQERRLNSWISTKQRG